VVSHGPRPIPPQSCPFCHKTPEDNRDYLSLAFGFASLSRPVYAILMKDPHGESYGAFWSHAKKPVFE
jgi:uncharacterized protein (DUF736 family)